mgnify:FL=1
MTTLAACRVGSTYALAADRRISFGDEYASLADPKVRMAAPWLAIGAVGGSNAATWLRGVSIDEAPATRADAQAHLDALGEAFRLAAKEREFGSAALVGITPWGIVDFHSSGSVNFLDAAVSAQGSGGKIAQGAMYAIRDFHGDTLSAQAVADYGVRTAALYDAGTGGPVDVLTIAAAP